MAFAMVLAKLDAALQNTDAHLVLLGSTLALDAAFASAQLQGRRPRRQDIRDAYLFVETPDARGPDGDLLAFWRDVRDAVDHFIRFAGDGAAPKHRRIKSPDRSTKARAT